MIFLNSRFTLTTLDLKLLAVLLMVTDHIGVFFFPDQLIFRLIGRLSFPLFAWLIVNGIEHSKDRKKYFLRLLAFAVISQIPYLLAYREVIPGFMGLNIFFTLCLGFLAVQAIRNVTPHSFSLLLVGICALTAILLDASYGAGGVFCILAFYLFRKNIRAMFLSQLTIFLTSFMLPEFILPKASLNMVAVVQPFGALSVLFISWYNGERGPKMQYFFYLFYPVHLVILYLLGR